MNQVIFTIKENLPLTSNVFLMRLDGDTSEITRPGQFVNIKLNGFYLRRPISVCDCADGELAIIYKTVGEGTEKMSRLTAGEKLDVLTGLGNGYDTSAAGEKPLLLGGGVGVPPLYMLAKKLVSEGRTVTAILGFNKKDEIFFENEFAALGVRTVIATADGSYGEKGFVTDCMKNIDYSYFYTCGPEPMLKAVYRASATQGEMSFERRMGCGFGACMGCSCKTVTGNKRICREGPVMKKEDIIWED